MGLKVATFLTNYVVPAFERGVQACKEKILELANKVTSLRKGALTQQVEASGKEMVKETLKGVGVQYVGMTLGSLYPGVVIVTGTGYALSKAVEPAFRSLNPMASPEKLNVWVTGTQVAIALSLTSVAVLMITTGSFDPSTLAIPGLPYALSLLGTVIGGRTALCLASRDPTDPKDAWFDGYLGRNIRYMAASQIVQLFPRPSQLVASYLSFHYPACGAVATLADQVGSVGHTLTGIVAAHAAYYAVPLANTVHRCIKFTPVKSNYNNLDPNLLAKTAIDVFNINPVKQIENIPAVGPLLSWAASQGIERDLAVNVLVRSINSYGALIQKNYLIEANTRELKEAIQEFHKLQKALEEQEGVQLQRRHIAKAEEELKNRAPSYMQELLAEFSQSLISPTDIEKKRDELKKVREQFKSPEFRNAFANGVARADEQEIYKELGKKEVMGANSSIPLIVKLWKKAKDSRLMGDGIDLLLDKLEIVSMQSTLKRFVDPQILDVKDLSKKKEGVEAVLNDPTIQSQLESLPGKREAAKAKLQAILGPHSGSADIILDFLEVNHSLDLQAGLKVLLAHLNIQLKKEQLNRCLYHAVTAAHSNQAVTNFALPPALQSVLHNVFDNVEKQETHLFGMALTDKLHTQALAEVYAQNFLVVVMHNIAEVTKTRNNPVLQPDEIDQFYHNINELIGVPIPSTMTRGVQTVVAWTSSLLVKHGEFLPRIIAGAAGLEAKMIQDKTNDSKKFIPPNTPHPLAPSGEVPQLMSPAKAVTKGVETYYKGSRGLAQQLVNTPIVQRIMRKVLKTFVDQEVLANALVRSVNMFAKMLQEDGTIRQALQELADASPLTKEEKRRALNHAIYNCIHTTMSISYMESVLVYSTKSIIATRLTHAMTALFAELESSNANLFTTNLLNPDYDKNTLEAVIRGFTILFVLIAQNTTRLFALATTEEQRKLLELRQEETEQFYANIQQLIFAPFSHPLTEGLQHVVKTGLPLVLNEEIMTKCLELVANLNMEKIDQALEDGFVVVPPAVAPIAEAPRVQPTLLSKIKTVWNQFKTLALQIISYVATKIASIFFRPRQPEEVQLRPIHLVL
jgi:hypothetical protein